MLSKVAPPTDLDLISPRDDTVSAIWRKMESYHFFWVHGPPGSGKTTLAWLMQDYVNKHLLDAIVIPVVGWSGKNQDEYRKLKQSVQAPYRKVFIFDEVQMTYGDVNIWIGIFKMLHQDIASFAIGFASYGSPVPRVAFHGLKMFVQPAQRITLQPFDHEDECPAVGLTFTKEEFSDFLGRRYGNRGGHHFSGGFLDGIFGATGGHIGAIHDILELVDSGIDYKRLQLSDSNIRYDVDVFKRQFPPEVLITHIATSLHILRNGLPSDEHLQDAAVSRALSLVAQRTIVTDRYVQEDVKNILESCTRLGLIHSDLYSHEPGEYIVGYSFPSSFHQWYTQWKLFTRNEPAQPLGANNLLHFVFDVIRLFNPQRLLSTETRKGPALIERPEGTEFQDEIHRCGHVLSAGCLVSFPEFGMTLPHLKNQRVDFYVPSKKWGIELVREGDAGELEQHGGRFSRSHELSGPPVDDYVILDCRSSVPQDEHPNIDKLFRIVFQEDYREVTVLDNRNQLIQEFTLAVQ